MKKNEIKCKGCYFGEECENDKETENDEPFVMCHNQYSIEHNHINPADYSCGDGIPKVKK
jgi:hypothetical protein